MLLHEQLLNAVRGVAGVQAASGSQLTPVGEASRGYRYRTTACWFVVGALVGGAMLGGVTAGLAMAISSLGA